ncbi:methyltransferase [Porphyromonas phage phage005b_ATCC49417]|uniref:DNA methylase N-4/N-6 domain-containing protein n=2 Tax=root TaxID=1 RepID=A0AAE9X9R2_PORGN|nr:hypothetical protein [Porphyromonas gingivalis]WCG02598.1 hypothetical protein NY151_08015 [Porphyromonas gingivalis]SJL29138.1 hypothetical protein PGIN_ATCC49417_00854 [Porphyromonas gingivalis]
MIRIEHLNKIRLINADCMDVLRELPDNAFDLAIVDPPYSKAGGEKGSPLSKARRFIRVAAKKIRKEWG